MSGEEIEVHQQGDKWWSGQSKGNIGWFPKTYVILKDTLPPPPPPPPPTTITAGEDEQEASAPATPTTASEGLEDIFYEAIYEFVGSTEEDLSFYVGDVIKVGLGH